MSRQREQTSPKNEPDSTPHGFGVWLQQRKRRHQTTYKFQVEGPWNIGDPVHEAITNAALQNTGLIPKGTAFTDPAVWEYLRGVFWNDDPEGFFFDNNETETDNWSNGVTFLSKFTSHKYAAVGGTVFGPGTPLLARSHFGDLQSLHAMAAGDGEPATTTLDAILRWLEFFYGVASGTVLETELLSAVTTGHIHKWFPQYSVSVHTLFLVGRKGNVRHRAIGAFLHVVQDSYAKGHVERDMSNAILEFHSYIHQDSSKHAHDDLIPEGGLQAMPEVQCAILRCSTILQLWEQKAQWRDVQKYLEAEIFPLAPHARLSGPGDAYLA